MGKNGQNFITKKLKISRQKLDDIIHNKGVLGQVLDIADRITYTMIDLHAIIPKKLTLPTTNTAESLLYTMSRFLSKNPEFGNIYKEVKIDKNKGKVYFENTKHLEIFLTLRAHLYGALYLNPDNQGRDLFAAKILKNLYSRTDPDAPLTPQKLRLMQDEDLLKIIKEHYSPEEQFPYGIYKDLGNWSPKYKEFGIHYLERAKKYAEELGKNKNIAVIGIQKCKGFDPATSYNVLDKNHNIVTFREFDPDHAVWTEVIAEETKRVYVFYADVSREPESTNTLLKSIFMQKNS